MKYDVTKCERCGALALPGHLCAEDVRNTLRERHDEVCKSICDSNALIDRIEMRRNTEKEEIGEIAEAVLVIEGARREAGEKPLSVHEIIGVVALHFAKQERYLVEHLRGMSLDDDSGGA